MCSCDKILFMITEFEKEYIKARKDYIRARFSQLNDRQIEAVMATEGPLLLLAGTLDEQSPAYLAEDIALAAGGRARVELIEGASHGMARYMDAQRYYAALLAFLKEEV